MNFHEHALILAMIETLARQKSRTGKSHIIKGLFLAGAAGLLDLPFQFFLYKHGPYSTDVEDRVEEMKSYGAANVEPAFDGYGVILGPGKMADFCKTRAPLSDKEREGIEQVCQFLRYRNAAELERLATAAWIRKREQLQDPDDVARRLNELKPHVSLEEARQADERICGFFGDVGRQEMQ